MRSMRRVTLIRTERENKMELLSPAAAAIGFRAGVSEPRWEKGAERFHKSQIQVKKTLQAR
ncbi:hypothetical protein chiPu_0023354, partial [Chiloscyllium punctatum]|nr:hypothetical protein [Chiloscyllium punctatum]